MDQIFDVDVSFSKHQINVSADDFGFFIRHNIHSPESLADFGKMFVEPGSIGFKFPVEQGGFSGRMFFGEKEDDPFLISVDFPYEYSQKFDKASPMDQEEMQKDMEIKTKELFDKLLPLVTGLSFYKKDAQQDAHIPKNMRIDEIHFEGYASGETASGLDQNDPRNQELSELRAENAAKILTKMLRQKGIEVKDVDFTGKGELHLNPAERDALLKDAYVLKIGNDGMLEDQAILNLIKKYNEQKITDAEIQNELEQIVGGKRKVAVVVESVERPAIFVLPIPIIFHPKIGDIFKRLWLNLRWPRKPGKAVYAHFISQKDVPPPPEPDQPRELDQQTIERAQNIGKNIRGAWRSKPRKEIIKGYAPTTEGTQAQVRDLIVENAPHRDKRKLTPRSKVELHFNKDLSIEEQVGAMAFVVDRYARMANRLYNRRDISNVDLVNVLEDPTILRSFIEQVAAAEDLQTHPLPDLTAFRGPNFPDVTFQFISGNPRRLPHGFGTAGERSTLLADMRHITVNGIGYRLYLQKLAELADQYRQTHRLT